MSQGPILTLENLVKTYESEKEVLKNINIRLKNGEIFVIMGPSGVGKSTLLRLIDLLDNPTSGKILFHDLDITQSLGRNRLNFRRKMGMVFQNTILFDGNVYNNVAYGVKLRKIKKNEIRSKIIKALDTVGLANLEKRHVNTLSGGEAQRVAIARVLVYEPEILLLDEPTANLDPANTANIETAIRKARDTYGTTVILATHNMYQAKRLGDRIAVLLDGQFIEVGDRDTIFDHPQQELTRKFINGEIIY